VDKERNNEGIEDVVAKVANNRDNDQGPNEGSVVDGINQRGRRGYRSKRGSRRERRRKEERIRGCVDVTSRSVPECPVGTRGVLGERVTKKSGVEGSAVREDHGSRITFDIFVGWRPTWKFPPRKGPGPPRSGSANWTLGFSGPPRNGAVTKHHGVGWTSLSAKLPWSREKEPVPEPW